MPLRPENSSDQPEDRDHDRGHSPPPRGQGVEHEPIGFPSKPAPRPPGPDNSEQRSERTLNRQRRTDDATYRDGQSVYDEPNVFPGRRGEPIEQDWNCSACGYNLRGLGVGHPCPECGRIELYSPPPAGADSYQTWLARKQAETTSTMAWQTVALVIVIGGPLGVVGAMMETAQPGLTGRSMALLAVIFGPAVEEVTKIMATLFVIETRPYRFQKISQIQASAIGSAVLFAVLENVLYLTLYVADPSVLLSLWRWTICVALHVGCTTLSSRGLVIIWGDVITQRRAPSLSRLTPWLIAAILVHACYNAAMVGLEILYPQWLR